METITPKHLFITILLLTIIGSTLAPKKWMNCVCPIPRQNRSPSSSPDLSVANATQNTTSVPLDPIDPIIENITDLAIRISYQETLRRGNDRLSERLAREPELERRIENLEEQWRGLDRIISSPNYHDVNQDERLRHLEQLRKLFDEYKALIAASIPESSEHHAESSEQSQAEASRSRSPQRVAIFEDAQGNRQPYLMVSKKWKNEKS